MSAGMGDNRAQGRMWASSIVVCQTFPPNRADHAQQIEFAVGFKALVAPLEKASLVDTLKGDGPYTVFAPTDTAFAKLPQGALEDFLKDQEKLAAVLMYHIVPGKLMSANLKPGQVKTCRVNRSPSP